MYNVIVIHTNNTVDNIALKAKPTLRQMQSWVGGYIERHPTSTYSIHEQLFKKYAMAMYFNDEGKLSNLPDNALASLIAGIPLVGDVVIIEGFDLD